MRGKLFILACFVFVLLPNFADAALISRPANNLGLVGYWNLNEATSTHATDLSGNNYTGAISNGTWTFGKHFSGLSFNGSNSSVNVGDISGPSSAITISAWVYKNANTAWSSILDRYGSEALDCFSLGFDNTNGKKLMFIWNASVGDGWANKITGNSDIPTGQWVHVAVSSNGSTATFYVNGVADGGTTVGSVCSTGNVYMGVNYAGGDEYFNGRLDDVRLYNRALTAGEIQTLYHTGEVRFTTSNTSITNGLVGWWTMDGKDTIWTSSSAGRAEDKSGTANTGTLNNMNRSTAITRGKVGQALSFDGSNTYITLGNPSSLQINEGTIIAWIKTADAGSSFRGIVQKAQAYGLYLLNNTFGVYDDAASTWRSSDVALNDNTWHQVAAVLDSGVSNGTLLYVDGEFITGVTQTVDTQTSSAIIGRGQGGAGQTFTGDIDDVRIYNRKLSTSEIKQIYDETAGITFNTDIATNSLTQGLIGYWSFDGADVTDKVYDRSGQGNNGYLNSNAATSSMKVIGKVGQAGNFVGTYSVHLPNIPLNGTSFSVGMWVKPDDFAANRGIFGQSDSGGCGTNLCLHLAIRSQKAHFGLHGDDVTSSGLLATSTWQYLAFVYDKSVGKKYIYINGVLDNTDNSSADFIGTGGDTYIGDDPCCDPVFQGGLDEVRLYNRALTASEVKRLYNEGK